MTYNSIMRDLDHKNRRIGQPYESFEQRYQRTLGQRLAPLGPDIPHALDAISGLVSLIQDPHIRDGIKADLVFRVLEGTQDSMDFRRRLLGYSADLEKRKFTMGGHPIISEPTTD